jgi:hypothetical protein
MINKNIDRRERIDNAKVIKIIEIELVRGVGTKEDVCRICKQYYSFEGKLLAEYDPEDN